MLNYALKLDPEFPEAHFNLGNLLIQQGNIKKAIYRYKKAIEYNPSFADAYTNLANAFKREGDIEKSTLL